MKKNEYLEQARFMLHALPYVAKETCFALKGGTAINFFVKDMPRLSVDIDLAYLPDEERSESLKNIGEALERIAQDMRHIYKVDLYKAEEAITQTENLRFTSKLLVTSDARVIKIEPNIVFRGAVYPPEKRALVKVAQDRFELSVSVLTLSRADLYGGKICAALDRQQPRDLFDVKMLLETNGITSEIIKAFVIYLAGHNRPMHELLNPNYLDIRLEYESAFFGLTETNVSCEELVKCQKRLPLLLREQLSKDDKKFLISLCKGKPIWDLLGITGIERLPALQWKLTNIEKMNRDKRDKQTKLLKSIL